MTRSLPWAVNEPPMTDPMLFQQQGARPKTTPKHIGFPNPPWTLVMESCQLGQECTTDQPQDHRMATMVTPEFPKENWDEEPALPTGLTDRERIVDWANATEGDDTQEDEPLMQAAGGEVPTWVEPKARLEGQVGVLEGPTHGDPDTNQEEVMEVPVLDEPPVVEAAGGVIEMGTVKGPECPGDTAPGNVDESPKAIPAPMPVLPP